MTWPKGLPIGNLTSQFFANVLLNELDQFVHEQVGPGDYVRYADDVVLFDDDRPKLRQARDFQVWLFQHSAKFPRQYRHTLTERLELSLLDFQRCLGRAALLKDKTALAEADLELWQVRQLLRLAHDLNVLPASLLQYAFEAVTELGRLLGSWRAKGTGT